MLRFSQKKPRKKVGDARKVAVALTFVTAVAFAHDQAFYVLQNEMCFLIMGSNFKKGEDVRSLRAFTSSFPLSLFSFLYPQLMLPSNTLPPFFTPWAHSKQRYRITLSFCAIARGKFWC